MNDFASAVMITLIRHGLARQGITPDVPARLTTPKATVPLADKRHLLLGIHERHGTLAVLRIGQAIEDMRHEPALNALLRAQSPVDLVERWQRLEHYVHSRHRCILEEAGDRCVVVRHISLTPDASPHAKSAPALAALARPCAAEDMLVMGVMIALLEASGCDGLRAAFGDSGDPVYVDGKFRRAGMHKCRERRTRRSGHESGARAIQDTGTWRFSWTSYNPASRGHVSASWEAGCQERPASWQETSLVPQQTSLPLVVNQCSAIMSGDVAYRWSVPVLATRLNTSVRTLQRRMGEVPVKFQEIVRAVQLREASRLLLDTQYELTMIGFCCGFSDYSHFSREFKKHTNLSPSEFRRKFAAT
jgi:AraC-like DNA-binding protein